jgi:hypothetical protein
VMPIGKRNSDHATMAERLQTRVRFPPSPPFIETNGHSIRLLPLSVWPLPTNQAALGAKTPHAAGSGGRIWAGHAGTFHDAEWPSSVGAQGSVSGRAESAASHLADLDLLALDP